MWPGHSLGLAPKKSLAIQAGRMTLLGVVPVLGMSGADVGAVLADLTAPVVAPVPSVVVEQAASSVAGAVQPVEGLVSSTEVVPEGAVQSMPLETQVEVAATAPSPTELDVAVMAPDGVAQSMPPAAQAVADEAGWMEANMAGGSSGVVVVPRRIRREPPPAPLSEGSHSPVLGEPPLQWMAAQDPTSALFSLDNHAESMEREGLDIGILTMLAALDQARGALREIVVPTTQVFA